MTISRPDYSNLINATAANASVNNMVATQKANEAQAAGDFAMTIFKTSMDVAAQVIKTQDTAQQSQLEPELEEKGKTYNLLLEESIKNGTTTISKDENGKLTVNYAPEVLEYRNTWLDDVNSREGLSNNVLQWASDVMDGVYNRSDEQVIYTIAANNATLASNDLDKTVKDAAYTAAQMGDASYLEKVIDSLDISDQYKTAYKQSYMPVYESEYQSLHSRDLAKTEGIQAAYSYIDGLAIDTATKDTLKKNAFAQYQSDLQALKVDTDRQVESLLQGGSSWAEIHNALENQEGLSAEKRSLIRDEVIAMQSKQVTNTCAPYLAQVQSGTMSVDELNDVKTLLEQNKQLFSGGLEGTYQSYMGIVDNAISAKESSDAAAMQTETSADLAQFKLQADNYYDLWNQGVISGEEALAQIRAIAEANPNDLNVVNSMNDFVNKIISEQVPLAYRGYFNMKMDGFSTIYANQAKTLGSSEMTADYVSNYETLYKDTINFIAANKDMELKDIDDFMSKEMDGFFSRYADAKAQELAAAEAAPTSTPVTIPTADYNNAADTILNNWNAGLISTEEALNYYQSMTQTASSDTSVMEKISSNIATIQKQKVPSAWKDSYDKAVNSFDSRYIRELDVKKLDDLDDDQYVKYLDNKSYFEGALADYISRNPGLTQADINAEAQRIMKTFSAPYATKEVSLEWKVDTAKSQASSFVANLQSFAETTPFEYSYNQATGKMQYQWVNQTAKENWDNVGRYGLQSLNAAGYDVNSFEILELGSTAYPMMVFKSTDGKAMFTINTSEDNPGAVMQLEIKNVGGQKMVSMTEITPAQAEKAAIARGAEYGPHNYVFDTSTMGDTVTPKAEGSNFVTQQTTMQAEKKAAEDAARQEEQRAMNEQFVQDRASGTLTSTQEAWASELEAAGYDYNESRQLAPLVDKYMTEERLTWEEAVKKAVQELGIEEETSEPENPSTKTEKNTEPRQGFRVW